MGQGAWPWSDHEIHDSCCSFDVTSVPIAAIALSLVGRDASHLLFLVVAGLLGLLLGRIETGRLNVFVKRLYRPTFL
jgi:hypothetical protein